MRAGVVLRAGALAIAFAMVAGLAGCSSEKVKNQAKEAAARYWQEKAYPGKSYDVQVVDAEKTSDGTYRVKGIVDGETRVGTFSPESETFSEGYYSLAHERSKEIAELQQQVQYWKEKAQNYEKEIYKLKVRMNLPDDASADDVKPSAAAAAAAPAQTPAAAKPSQ
jgi:hypothetical protein